MMVTPVARSAAHQLPHVAAQLDVDAGGRLVEKQDPRLVRQRLGDQHAALHAARERHDLAVLLVPQRQVPAAPSRCAPGFGGLPNSPRLKDTVAQTVSNASVVSSCGTRPIMRARGAVVGDDVVAVDEDAALASG